MRAATQETPAPSSRRPARFYRPRAPKASRSRVLVQQVRVLRPPALAKVLHLHHLREHGHVHRRLGRLREVVPAQDLLVLVERALVPVLLQELLLPLGLVLARLLGVREVLFEALLFGQGAPPLDFFALFFAREFGFFVALDAGELAEPPGFELAGRVEPVGVV